MMKKVVIVSVLMLSLGALADEQKDQDIPAGEPYVNIDSVDHGPALKSMLRAFEAVKKTGSNIEKATEKHEKAKAQLHAFRDACKYVMANFPTTEDKQKDLPGTDL